MLRVRVIRGIPLDASDDMTDLHLGCWCLGIIGVEIIRAEFARRSQAYFFLGHRHDQMLHMMSSVLHALALARVALGLLECIAKSALVTVI